MIMAENFQSLKTAKLETFKKINYYLKNKIFITHAILWFFSSLIDVLHSQFVGFM